MSSIQYDYSTLSTSMSHEEFGSPLVCNYVDGSYNIAEEEEESSTDENFDSTEVPPAPITPFDRFYLVYVTFGLLGIATLLPFNFFITANDYWMYKLRNTRNESYINPIQPTPLQAKFTSYLTLAANTPFIVFLMLNTKYGQNFPQLHRMLGALGVILMAFITVTALVNVNTDKWQSPFFEITMFLVVLMGTSSAILQAAVTGVVSMLPPNYMHIMVLGQAIAGILATIAQIGSLLGHAHPEKSAFSYFMSANMFVAITIFAYLLTQKSDFFQYHLNRASSQTIMKDISGPMVKVNIPLIPVIKRILPFCLTIGINLWITISIFPGLAVLAQSVYAYDGSIWTDRLFLPLACFLLFNVSDFCGRIVGGWIQFPPRYGYHLLVGGVLRAIFIPLFLLCNAYPRNHLPVIFTSDIYYVSFITFLGLTNGFLMSVPLICGTKCLTVDLQETAGLILSAFIGAGLMLGSITSYLLVLIL